MLESKKMPDNKKSAKMSILQALHDEMSGMMGDDLKNVQRATVTASNPKSLKEGLEKAKEIVAQHESTEPEGDHEEETMGDMAKMHSDGSSDVSPQEASEEAEEEGEEDTPEEIDAQIRALEEKKRQLTKN